LVNSDPKVRDLIDIAKRLEGLARHASTHAAGVVISPRPLTDLLPLYKSSKDEITTMYPMTDVEKMGLLKMDFLALTTLTIIDDIIKRKHGAKRVEYELPELKKVLEETLGVIVYQEQVMQIANVVAGYSLGEADLLRRAMGKKKVEEMAAQRTKFVNGARDKGFKDERRITRIFDLMEQFAGYGFNKSPSAAYGVLPYRTAYLKA